MRRSRLISMVAAVGLVVSAVVVGTGNNVLDKWTKRDQAVAEAADKKDTAKFTDFSLFSLDGKKVRLSDVVKQNKVTIVNFFATWCPPCRAEMPDFIKFAAAYKKKDVSLVSVDLQESNSTVSKFVKEFGMTNTVLLDADGQVGNAYNVYSIPFTMIIDQKGFIKKTFTGMTSGDALRAAVDPLL